MDLKMMDTPEFRGKIERIIKALGVTAAGSILRQPEIDKVIAQMVEYKNPLRMNLPRKPGSGDAFYQNRRTPGTTGAEFVSDLGTLNQSGGSFAQVNFPYKTIAYNGVISRRLQAQGRSYANIAAQEIEAATLEFRKKEENGLFKGSVSSSALEFDGLDILIPSSQAVGMTTVTLGESITLAKLDEVIDTCIHEPDLILCSKRTSRQINALLQAQQRFVDKIEIKGGFKVPTYNGIPILRSTEIPDTQAWDGSAVTDEVSGGTSTLYVIDTDHCFISELTKVTILPLAKTTSQSDAFDIYCDEVLVMRNYLTCAKLIGITGS